MTRLALVTLLVLAAPAIVLAQNKEDEGKVSNDQPGRPLQMPPASTEVKEAFDDFERFSRRSAWERALKALYAIPEEQAGRFVDGDNGFIISVARRRRSVLSALSPEAQAAHRLFYDAEAKKLFDDAEGPLELKNLERLYSAYFISSVGDNAADRLGDLYFEMGQFDRAADCWLAILRERPDTDLSPALIAVKAALALSHTGRRAELTQVRADLADRYADEKVTLGGQTAPAIELLRRLVGNEPQAASAALPTSRASEAVLDHGAPIDPVWQMRFAESVEAGMTPPELNQWDANPLSIAVPATVVDGSRLFVNYLGSIFALDLTSGKMLWRSASFHNLETAAMQDQARMISPGRFAVIASGEYVWDLARDLKDQNYLAQFVLTCRRADGGEVVWRSADLHDYAGIDLMGTPLLVKGKLIVVGKGNSDPQNQQGTQQQLVLAIQPHDGKVLWKTDVGTFRQGQQFFYYGMSDSSPQPRLLYRAGVIYVDTHVGILARIDAESGVLDWGYGYQTDPVQNEGRFMFFGGYMPQNNPATTSGEPLPYGETLLIKGANSAQLSAVEPDRMKVLWNRPIAKSSRLLGGDDQVVYLGGPELTALDLKTRQLSWATHLPSGSSEGRLLVRPDGLWQLTPRGIFEIDPKSGDVRRIFRGSDLGSTGGDLLVTDQWLLAVSNRTISAYPRRANRVAAMKRASND